MKRAFLITAAVLAIVLAVGWYMSGGGKAPLGQPALVTLNTQNLESLFQQFDAASDKTRVVVLLSPT